MALSPHADHAAGRCPRRLAQPKRRVPIRLRHDGAGARILHDGCDRSMGLTFIGAFGFASFLSSLTLRKLTSIPRNSG